MEICIPKKIRGKYLMKTYLTDINQSFPSVRELGKQHFCICPKQRAYQERKRVQVIQRSTWRKIPEVSSRKKTSLTLSTWYSIYVDNVMTSSKNTWKSRLRTPIRIISKEIWNVEGVLLSPKTILCTITWPWVCWRTSFRGPLWLLGSSNRHSCHPLWWKN